MQSSARLFSGFTERHSDEKRANDKVLPAMKNSGDLRFARSLTTGRKPSSSNSSSSRLSVSSINLRSSSELNRLPPRQSPYESNHKQRMVTKYRELGQMLFDVMQPQMGDVSLPRQGWMLPVESHHRPKPSVHRKLLLSGYSDEQPSTAKDNCYLRSKQLKEQEAIEIMSEGSRTETPSVEIVSGKQVKSCPLQWLNYNYAEWKAFIMNPHIIRHRCRLWGGQPGAFLSLIEKHLWFQQ